MSKGLYMFFRTKEDKHRYDTISRAVCQQQTLDAVTIALHREFGFGPDRIQKFAQAFYDAWNDMCDLCNEDFAADKTFVYAKAKIDEVLKEAVGEKNFKPWEDRYKF